MEVKKEGSFKKCNNPKLAEKLPGFMDGSLSRKETQAFDNHMLECDECKKRFYFALDLDKLFKKVKPSLLVRKLRE